MNARQLADKIENVDEDLVAEAASAPPKRKRLWPGLVAAAAVLALAVGLWPALRGWGPGRFGETPPSPEGPTLTPPLPGSTPPLAGGDLMEGLSAEVPADFTTLTEENAALTADFGLRLLRACDTGGNVLVSPYSVLSALGMTALGARGQTLEEMTAVLGRDPEALGAYLRAYGESLDGETVSVANAIWLNHDALFRAEDDFLRKNADTYYAGVHVAPFDDRTCLTINRWARDHTRGMIPEILDRLPVDALMVLVNALAFEAKWERPYKTEDQLRVETFTAGDGTQRTVAMMFGGADGFFAGENASGFLKNYENGFAFAALLPDEGETVEELLASLTGEGLRALLSGAERTWDLCGIPKFTLEGDTDLKTALTAMGMSAAFDSVRADFSGLGTSETGNLFISRVLHKTLLEVAEDGTRAAAVTAVEVSDETVPSPPRLVLDRPFLCAIVDTSTYVPLFLALVRDIGE